MTGRLARSQATAFLALTGLCSVPFVVLNDIEIAPGLPGAATMVAVPALCAAGLVGANEGKRAALSWLGRTASGPPWPVWPALLCGTAALLGSTPFAAMPAAVPWRTSLFLAAGLLAAGLLEEIGWQGYLYPRLRSLAGRVPTALIIAVAWGAWHLPVLIAIGRGLEWILAWFLATIALRIMIVEAYERGRNSVPAAALAHGSYNIVLFILLPYLHRQFEPCLSALLLALITAATAADRLRAARGRE